MSNTDHLFARLQQSRDLPSLPQVLLQVIALEEQEPLDIQQLIKIIAQDPSISAKALRLVNSAYFNLQGRFTSLERAVLYLGADVIKNIAITASVHHVFNGVKQNGAFPMDRYWLNSFSCAIFSRRIAQQISYGNVEEAYIVGLLHNLGKLLLWKNFPKEYSNILPLIEAQTAECNAEKEQIGINHCEAGSWLIKHWKMNSFMADAVLYHHEPLARIKNGFPLVKITYLAHKLSKIQSAEEQDALLAMGNDLLQLDRQQMLAIIGGAQEEIDHIAASLELTIKKPASQDEPKPASLDKHSLHLVTKVQNNSHLAFFLEELLQADGKSAILQATEQALYVLLEIDTILFFLHNPDDKTLIGCTSPQNRFHELIQDLLLPVEATTNLAWAISKQEIIHIHKQTAGNDLSLAEVQLFDLIGEEGMVLVPMIAKDIPVGVIVLGLKECRLKDDARMLRLMANQTAHSLNLLDIRARQAKIIQAERLAATSLAAAKIAHEVNNPLAIIKNYFKIFELKFTNSSTLKEDLKILNDELDRISNIVQQLNNFAPTETKEQVKIDLNSLLADVAKILSKSILYNSKIEIHFIPDLDLPALVASADDIKQIIINIIKNGAEAIHEGGNIYLEAHRKEATNGQDRRQLQQGQIEIIIRDDGPGIAEEIAANLFDPFISTKEGTGNSGLGLSIVQNIVAKLNGTITCQSSKEQGTSFTIVLPIDGQSAS